MDSNILVAAITSSSAIVVAGNVLSNQEASV